MQQNQQHDLETIRRILQQIEQSQSLTEFETIKLPFELVQAAVSLWESTFEPEVLRELANTDTETLESWAISLRKTLDIQLDIFNAWLPHLTTLPLPTGLRQKISDRVQSIQQISREKSKLLQAVSELLDQEEVLQQSAKELRDLKEKARELQAIKKELQTTNLDHLRQEIAAQAAQLEPQQQVLTSLQQQKADLDDQIAALQRQQATVRDEIHYWQNRQNRLETTTTESVSELILLTQAQREQLSEALAQEITNLEKQRSELAQQQESYRQTQEQLQQAREDFEKYQTATEEIRTAIAIHYESNQTLSRFLPVEHHKVDVLFNQIQEILAQIDQELAAARNKHQQAQQKTRIPL